MTSGANSGPINRPRIAFVMEQTWGNVTHYLNLRRYEDEAKDLTPRWLPVSYRVSQLPWTVTGSLLARRAIAGAFDQIDGLLVHTATIAVLSADYLWRKPAILSTDATPLNKRDMRGWYGLPRRSRMTEWAKRRTYETVFRAAAGLVAFSQWAKTSFVEDYHCDEKSVCVIPPGVDVEQFVPAERTNELPKILFVGADFERKGGDLLLDVFRKRLRGRAELVLVTAAEVPPEQGVAVHRDVSAKSQKLIDLYSQCDIFALPTRADAHSLACMEAMAAALPVVATRVGGIPDLIQEGKTGILIAPDDADALTQALEWLVSNAELRRKMGQLGRQETLRNFDARQNARRLFEFIRSRV